MGRQLRLHWSPKINRNICVPLCCVTLNVDFGNKLYLSIHVHIIQSVQCPVWRRFTIASSYYPRE